MSELEGILCPGSAYVLEKVGVTGAETEKVIISVHPDRFEGCWFGCGSRATKVGVEAR
jgi:hypothetical protein